MSEKAIKNEADGIEEYTVEYDGDTYVVKKEMLTDIDVIEAFEDGKTVKAMRLVLGGRQWAKFRSNHRQGKQLDDLAQLLFEEVGDLGE